MTKKRMSITKPEGFDLAYQEEVEKAADRIGRDTFDGLAWLIQFSQLDLKAMSEGGKIDLGYELNCLADFLYTTSEDKGPFGDLGLSLQDWEGNNRYEGEPGGTTLAQVIATERQIRPPMPPPSLDQIINLQQYVASLMTEWLEHRCFSLDLPPIAVHVFSLEAIDAVGILKIATQPEDLFIHNVAFLLVNGSSRVRRCPECQRIFFADRKNKKSCSARCQNTAAVRRLRQKSSSTKKNQGKNPNPSKRKSTKN